MGLGYGGLCNHYCFREHRHDHVELAVENTDNGYSDGQPRRRVEETAAIRSCVEREWVNASGSYAPLLSLR